MQIILFVRMPGEFLFNIRKPFLTPGFLSFDDLPFFLFRAVFEEIQLAQKVGADLVHMVNRGMKPVFKSSFSCRCDGADLADGELRFLEREKKLDREQIVLGVVYILCIALLFAMQKAKLFG